MEIAVMDALEFAEAFVIGDIAFDDVLHSLSFLIEKAPKQKGLLDYLFLEDSPEFFVSDLTLENSM